MRATPRWAIALLMLTLVAPACGSSSSGATKDPAPKQTTSSTAAPGAPTGGSPDQQTCASAGFILSQGPDAATWKTTVGLAESLKTSDNVLDPMRRLSAALAQKDKDATASARADFLNVCKQVGS